MTLEQGNVALAIGAELWKLTWPLLAGFSLGLFALRALQRRGLRWTWSFLGIPLAYVVWFIFWHVGLILAVAALTAIWLGRRAHAEGLQLGGEEARAIGDARGPLRLVLSRLHGRGARQQRLKGDRLAIGSSRRGGVCRVPVGLFRGVHALIAGATGSGKSVTLSGFIPAYVLSHFATIVIDPKGDGYMRSVACESAHRAGSRFIEWTPTGPTIYNPLARGGPTEIADKALAAHQWSEPHYELATRRLLGHVLSTMQAAEMWPPTISQVVAHMDPERLDALASKVGGETAKRVSSYVDGLSDRGKADLGGGRDRLAVLADSELGPWLDPALGEGEQIDLAHSLRCGDVLYFNLDADRYPMAAKQVAAALLIDLVGLTADLQGTGVGGLVVIDEFAALAAEQVSRLFARARSAGLSLHLGTQSLADLRGARPGDPSDTLTEQVLSNVEFTIAHRIGDPDSAEKLARMAGTVSRLVDHAADQRHRGDHRQGRGNPDPRARVPDRPRPVQAAGGRRSGGDRPCCEAQRGDRAGVATGRWAQ